MSDPEDDIRARTPYAIQFAIWGIWRWLKNMTEATRMDVITKGLGYVLRLDFLDGYRTYLAGVGALLSGLSLIALYAAGDPHGDVKTGVEMVVAGIGLIGHAGKQDKLIAATKGDEKN